MLATKLGGGGTASGANATAGDARAGDAASDPGPMSVTSAFGTGAAGGSETRAGGGGRSFRGKGNGGLASGGADAEVTGFL